MPGVNKKRSKQGHELQFAVNHLGHFRLTQLLEENILSSNTVENPGRVLYLTSSGIEFWNGPGKDGLKAQIPPETRKYHPFLDPELLPVSSETRKRSIHLKPKQISEWNS